MLITILFYTTIKLLPYIGGFKMFVKPIKLSKKRGNGGHITSYTINIGSAKARECGFTDDDVELEKVVDFDKKEIIIRIKK